MIGRNFKMRALESNPYLTKGKIYEFVNGRCQLDKFMSSQYESVEDFQKFNKLAKVEEVGDVELPQKPKPATKETINIYRKKKSVVATISNGERSYSQFTRLSDANGDFKAAVKMVVERLMDKWGVDKDCLTASTFDWSAFKQGKFAVHCDTEEKARGFLNECNVNGITWCTGNDTTRQETRWDIYEDETCYGFSQYDTKGISYGHFEETEKIDYTPTITPSSPIKKVKRPAKVGEWVEILRVDSFTEDDHKVGDIFQTIKCTIGNSDNGAYYENKEDGCGYVDFGDYLVLENYTQEVTPEVVEEIVAPSKFVKAKVGDKIKFVRNFGDFFHGPNINIGDVLTVKEVHSDCVDTDTNNVLWDKHQEYEIVKIPESEPIKISDKLVSACTQEQLMKELFNRQGL